MAGDPTNAHLWANADVYVNFDPDTMNEPADIDADFDSGWDLVGLLNGDDGFTEARTQDEGDLFAWGNILVRTSRKNYKETKSFSALEDNDATFRLYRPGSTRGGDIVVPIVERVGLAFELIEGTVKHRLITAQYAEVNLAADVNVNETDLAKLEFLATIFPTGDTPAVLWHEQTNAVIGS